MKAYYTREQYEASKRELKEIQTQIKTLRGTERALTEKIKQIRALWEEQGYNPFNINILIRSEPVYIERKQIRIQLKQSRKRRDYLQSYIWYSEAIWKGNLECNIKGIAKVMMGSQKEWQGHNQLDLLQLIFRVKPTEEMNGYITLVKWRILKHYWKDWTLQDWIDLIIWRFTKGFTDNEFQIIHNVEENPQEAIKTLRIIIQKARQERISKEQLPADTTPQTTHKISHNEPQPASTTLF